MLSLALAAETASATELLGPEVGVEPFGMGRAYSAVADDALSLHYNPAGLALVNRLDLQIFDLRLGSNRDVAQSYKGLGDLGKSGSGSVAETMNKYAGKHIMATAGNNTQLTVPNFALGLLYNMHTDFDLENTSYPTTRMRYTKDLGFYAGGAFAAGPKKALRLGATLKYIHRTGGIRNVALSEISGNRKAIVDNFGASGSGYGADLGMQYRLPFPGRTEVTTSFVWHDVGHTSFGGMQQHNPPTRIDQNMVAGLGVRFPIGGRKNRRLERRYGSSRSTNHLSFAFDYSHLNYSLDREHLPKHLHVGMNLDLPIFSLQLGLNQTALTFGTAFDIGILKVELATYGEELGSYAGQKVDRRYLLSIGSSLGFGGL